MKPARASSKASVPNSMQCRRPQHSRFWSCSCGKNSREQTFAACLTSNSSVQFSCSASISVMTRRCLCRSSSLGPCCSRISAPELLFLLQLLLLCRCFAWRTIGSSPCQTTLGSYPASPSWMSQPTACGSCQAAWAG